ncbi:MAG: hypothetical protein IIX84_05720 [Oscillospiraceae bacterium]|nr:hypothetical protein [Oscillospiraceae bacterium]
MKNKKKLIIILAIVLSAVTLMFIGVFAAVAAFAAKRVERNRAESSEATAVIREEVNMPENSKDLERKYIRLETEDGLYTLVYKKELPEFLDELSIGDIFCVEPNKRADEAFFANGFSGVVVSKSVRGNEAKISFAVPDITELFSELDISLADDGTKIDSVLFIPEGESKSELSLWNAGSAASNSGVMLSASPAALAAIKLNEENADFSMKKGRTPSLLPDYAYICEEMKIKTKAECEVGPLALELDGKVILEDLAVKSDIAYHTNESTGEIVIDNYDVGVIANHRVDMTVKPSVSAGLDDIGGGFNIIDFKDATDAEDGKMVLGTFLVGFSVPFIESDTNKVSYLSLGLAIQLTVTAEGEISMECNISQKGYSRIEADSFGNVTEEIRGYDFPNPAVTSARPTAEQLASLPETEVKAAGEIDLHGAFGIDAGLCIFGTVPVKISNNIIDIRYVRNDLFFDSANIDGVDEKTDVFKNGYMLDKHSELFKVSTTSFLRVNVGFESDLDVLNFTSFDIGAEAQLFNRVLYQYPDPVGFSSAQCDFGGISIGKIYSREEVEDTFKQHQKDVGSYSIVGNIKDRVVNSAINGFIEGIDPDRLELGGEIDWSEYLGELNVAVFPSGALYLMDSKGLVVCELITGESIMNSSGFCCGMNKTKTEIIYSVPGYQESAHIELGELLEIGEYGEYVEAILGFEGGEVTLYFYESNDSEDVMALLFIDDTLKLIGVGNVLLIEEILGY